MLNIRGAGTSGQQTRKKRNQRNNAQRNLKPKDKFPDVKGPPNKHGKRPHMCVRAHIHTHTHRHFKGKTSEHHTDTILKFLGKKKKTAKKVRERSTEIFNRQTTGLLKSNTFWTIQQQGLQF